MQILAGSARQTRCIFCKFRAAAAFATHASTPSSSRNGRDGGGGRARLHRSNGHSNGPSDTDATFHFDPSRQYTPIRHGPIHDKILSRLDELEPFIARDSMFEKLELEDAELNARFAELRSQVKLVISQKGFTQPLVKKLRNAMADSGTEAFDFEVKGELFSRIVVSRFSKEQLRDQESLANMSNPQEWYPPTRGYRREFHIHVGPTNSGKTYQALQRLRNAKTGLYGGPLRLLAHEIYLRLNAQGKRCNLITGDDRRTADDQPYAPMSSCTVEMMPLSVAVDVAVIDEIQLIGTLDRGWAWTQALLGVQAKEVHLCGEERALPIVQELVAMCGEELHVHRYERLSPLKMMSKSLDGNLQNLRKGDCVVSFSIVGIHALKQQIQKTLNVKVAVIYGSLPPETRAQQAKLFNDPDNDYDILVASDAVGMGLNLNIKRMVFQASQKYFEGAWHALETHSVKQMAGRAGRFSTADEDMKRAASNFDLFELEALDAKAVTPAPRAKQIGLVTTLEKYDFPVVASAMGSEPAPIKSAGLIPADFVVRRFAKCFPKETPFSFILKRLGDVARFGSRFHLCIETAHRSIADVIESARGLTVSDKLIFCTAPIGRTDEERVLARRLAECVAGARPVRILDIEELQVGLLDDGYEPSRRYLWKLETLSKGVTLWMWLSYRYPAVFIDQELAIHIRDLTYSKIEDVLARRNFDYEGMRKRREQAALMMRPESMSETVKEDGLGHRESDQSVRAESDVVPNSRERDAEHSNDSGYDTEAEPDTPKALRNERQSPNATIDFMREQRRLESVRHSASG